LLQLEGNRAEWNSLKAELMGSQGLTAGCSAVGGMEWQVLLFNAVPVISYKLLRGSLFPNCKRKQNNYLHSNFWHKKHPDS